MKNKKNVAFEKGNLANSTKWNTFKNWHNMCKKFPDSRGCLYGTLIFRAQ